MAKSTNKKRKVIVDSTGEAHINASFNNIIISITNVQVLHDNIAISSRFFCVLCSLFIYNTKLLSCTKGFPPYQINISLA